MNIKKITAIFQNRLAGLDWKLLIFLLLFLNVKLVVKVIALVLIYSIRPNFKWGFGIKSSRLPPFYLIVIAIAIVNWLLSGLLPNINYLLAFSTGIMFWLLCILAAHQVKLSVETNSPAAIHKTLLLFFIINALASLAIYAGIIWETGTVNAYTYQGNFQKYFISTGDFIKGITLDTSTTNAVINAFGVIYFLLRHKYAWAILCMGILLLTGSNFTNLLLCLVLLFIFVFQSNKNQKSIIVVCWLLLVVFLVKVSPQNNKYMANAYDKFFKPHTTVAAIAVNPVAITQQPDSILSPEEKKQKLAQLYLDSMYAAMDEKKMVAAATPQPTTAVPELKIKPVIPQANIHSAPYQHKNDTTALQATLIDFIKKDSIEQDVVAVKKYKLPGKIIALLQTVDYFKIHPLKIISGTGMGLFSSKLAFRISALKIAGGYPVQYAYISNDFKNNHLSLYLNYFTGTADVHSLINTPNSTYTQLWSEYGILGLLSFAVFYLGFFAKQYKTLTYGIPLLLLMAGLFFAEYWFEQLSVTVLFELLLFLNSKENNTTTVQT